MPTEQPSMSQSSCQHNDHRTDLGRRLKKALSPPLLRPTQVTPFFHFVESRLGSRPVFPTLGLVIMPGGCLAGSVGLEGVSPAVHEEVKVIRHHASGRVEMTPPHYLLPEVMWMRL